MRSLRSSSLPLSSVAMRFAPPSITRGRPPGRPQVESPSTNKPRRPHPATSAESENLLSLGQDLVQRIPEIRRRASHLQPHLLDVLLPALEDLFLELRPQRPHLETA